MIIIKQNYIKIIINLIMEYYAVLELNPLPPKKILRRHIID